jgi:Arc/MetJ-type ribon-helix-helix transcriptional regulator
MTAKIAISLPDEYVAAARRAVEEGRAPSVSAYVAESIALRERSDSLRALLDELDRELGSPTDEALAWADQALGLA